MTKKKGQQITATVKYDPITYKFFIRFSYPFLIIFSYFLSILTHFRHFLIIFRQFWTFFDEK